MTPFPRLEHRGTILVEYITELFYDTDAVRLARVISGETGDLRGMHAVAQRGPEGPDITRGAYHYWASPVERQSTYDR